jgi:NAD(P)-dependent dehydrogenase (short-subunit alcohol dehydrogenase family)
MARVAGKTALVSGGASGIGAATCRMLAREGAAVVVADVQDELGESVAADIRAAGGEAVFQRLDVRQEESWTAATARAEAEFGRLNILVNNAGVGSPMGNVETQSLEDWRKVMSVNADGVFLGVKAGIQAIRRGGEAGSIVNLSSIVGLVGLASSAAYTASKGAVRLLTKSAALYCAREKLPIRCNSIHPGPIDTPIFDPWKAGAQEETDALMAGLREMTPMGRIGRPEEIAAMALFLASDESSFSTGAEFVADGGGTAALAGL